jgi:putative two-component system response regulator
MGKKHRILLVDDEMNVIKALIRVLSYKYFNVIYTTSPKEAMEILQNQEVDIIVCDQRMPTIRGIELLIHAKKISPGTIRILMTGYSDLDVIVSAINDGNIFHYVSKPWKNEELVEVIDNAIRYKESQDEKEIILNKLLSDKSEWARTVEYLEILVSEGRQKAINALLRIIAAKDVELYNHSKRVAEYALKVATLMGLTEKQKENIEYAAMFHDIGKIAIRDKVLYKPGRLDDNEFEHMKNHAAVSYEILVELGFLNDVATIVYQHHERVDGNGYPRGLKDEDILLEAKIIAIADTYDALVSDRVYRKGLEMDKAIEILRSESNKYYDAKVVEIFIGGLRNE